MASYERLSPQDASFLYMESPTEPMHVGALTIFEDPSVDFETICDHIDRRIDLVPKFRKKLMWVPLQQGRPVWVDDPDFDVRYHVRHTGLPRPGGERELLTLMARIQSIPLDRTRPLWELWFVDLPDERLAMIQKTHHALIDGVSGVDLATVLLDLTPDSPDIPTKGWKPEPAPSEVQLVRDALRERLTSPAEVVRSVRAATRAPRQAAERAAEQARSLLQFGRAGMEAAPSTSINVPIGAHRRFEVVRTRLEDVKAVKNHFGSTVNDVVLAMVAGGLRRYLTERGDDVTGLYMRVLVPVSVRAEHERGTYGNRVAGLFAQLPIAEPDPLERLRFVQAEMGKLKESDEALGAETIMRLADYAPPTIMALAGRAMARARALNLTVTNVPGPQFPLYFRGGKMLEAFPWVPLIHKTAVGVAVVSYNGGLDFGLAGDWDVVPDLAVFAEGIEKSLAEYREAM